MQIESLDKLGKKYSLMIDEKNIDLDALKQFEEVMKLDTSVQGFLAPDYHLGYTLPIGCVWKTKGKIFPSAVGYDIGCGVCAIKTSVNIDSISKKDLELLKAKILKRIPLGFNHHKKKQKINDYNGVSDIAKEVFKNLAPFQIGTLGGGNHFIEIGTDYEDFLNVIIHSGSRGIGHKIANYYMKTAHNLEIVKKHTNIDIDIKYIEAFKMKNSEWLVNIQKKGESMEKYNAALDKYINGQKKKIKGNIEGYYSFDINSDIGKGYIKDMNSALEFALDNRKRMVEEVIEAMREILGNVQTSRFINRNHNHAEVKDGYIIHRKGATHAEKGMMGVIPGNMKDGSFIVEGKGNSESMCSSSHGAGRIMGRKEAQRKLSYTKLEKMMKNVVTNLNWSMLDESPSAYKNIFEVMRNQKDLVTVIDRIIPVLNIKG